jgi:hypothetical protein
MGFSMIFLVLLLRNLLHTMDEKHSTGKMHEMLQIAVSADAVVNRKIVF